MLIWAGDEVLKAYLQLQLILEEENKDQVASAAADVITAIREDLGTTNQPLECEKLIQRLQHLVKD